MNPHIKLTAAEKRVATSILRGENPREIRSRLSLTESQYRSHVKHLMAKVHAHNPRELAMRLLHQ